MKSIFPKVNFGSGDDGDKELNQRLLKSGIGKMREIIELNKDYERDVAIVVAISGRFDDEEEAHYELSFSVSSWGMSQLFSLTDIGPIMGGGAQMAHERGEFLFCHYTEQDDISGLKDRYGIVTVEVWCLHPNDGANATKYETDKAKLIVNDLLVLYEAWLTREEYGRDPYLVFR